MRLQCVLIYTYMFPALKSGTWSRYLVDTCPWVPLQDEEFGQQSTLGRSRNRNSKGIGNNANTGVGGGGGGGGRRTSSAKSVPKIENVELIAASKTNILMVQVETVHTTLSKQLLDSTSLFKTAGFEDAPKLIMVL